MASTEFCTGFECSQTYDKALFQDKTIDQILPLLEAQFKTPKYDVSGSRNFSQTRYVNMKVKKHPSYSNGAIPFVYFMSNNNILTFFDIIDWDGSRYASAFNEVDSTDSYYYWYDGSTRTNSISGASALNQDSKISNDNYRLGDFWTGEHGYPFYINTNMPLFRVADDFDYNNANIKEYIRGNISAEELLGLYDKVLEIVNKKAQDTEPDGEEFEITNIGTSGTFTQYGASIGTERFYRFVKGKVLNGHLALYKIEGIDGGSLKYGISLLGELYGCQYSVDGITWQDTDTFPFDFLYRERTNELGTFNFALTNSVTKTPIFSSQSDATEYQQGTKDITEAENWSDISIYNKDIVNGTGVSDDTTTFGEVYTRAFFSQQYILSSGAIQEISNGLFDTSTGGIFEKIKKGVEMFGENPIESVQSLVYYPMDLTTVFTNTASQPYVYFGSYQLQLTNSVAHKIYFPNGYKDLGTFDIKPSFHNYRDYEPYSKLRVYLPYVGWKQLDIKRYLNKSVKVRYYIDTRTNGTCTACLIADNLLVDYFDGQMGVSMPLTMTDYSAYANTQIQTLLSGASTIAGGIPSIGGAIANGVTSASGGDKLGAIENFGSAVAGAGDSVVQAGKTTYGLNTSNINNFNNTRGCSSSMINQYLPQEVLFEFEYLDISDTSNAVELRGYPSNASGNINNFSGYLEVEDVKLVCNNATSSEKSEILQLLSTGIFI